MTINNFRNFAFVIISSNAYFLFFPVSLHFFKTIFQTSKKKKSEIVSPCYITAARHYTTENTKSIQVRSGKKQRYRECIIETLNIPFHDANSRIKRPMFLQHWKLYKKTRQDMTKNRRLSNINIFIWLIHNYK